MDSFILDKQSLVHLTSSDKTYWDMFTEIDETVWREKERKKN